MIIYQHNVQHTQPQNRGGIVSLVPSLTELLHYFKLGDRVKGITKFCVHPKGWKKEKKIVGGTKQQRVEVIREINPDIIIANKEENTKENIEDLAKDYTVYLSDIVTIEDAFIAIEEIGYLLGKYKESKELTHSIQNGFEQLKNENASIQKNKIAYCIWKDPYMWAGQSTFINSILTYAGFENVVKADRYPKISLESIAELSPDYIWLSSEPYPFKQKHKDHIAQMFNIKALLVDGEPFSWYGSRLLHTSDYIKSISSNINANLL